MNYVEKESKFIVWIAALGLLLVILVAVISVLNDRGSFKDLFNNDKDQEQEDQDGSEETNEENSGEFSNSKYGITFTTEDLEIRENPSLAHAIEVLDCRKMSSSLRESLVKDGTAVCYEIMIVLSDSSYIVITTGDSSYKDPRESFIDPEDGSDLHIFPSSKINLPMETIDISSFPTNMKGTKIVYDTEGSFIFYEGVVYKGADKYAIKVFGEIDGDVKEIIRSFELE